jgi:hypothetical protein
MLIDGKRVEVDLYLSDNFGIEYDGYFSHLERGKKDE